MSSEQRVFAPPSHPPPGDGETRPLPNGWISQYDDKSQAWFYVDTTTTPPRSSWVHPLDDPEYLKRHPDTKGHESPPGYERSPSPPSVPVASGPNLNDKGKGKGPEKRGFLGKLKDKAIGTKEEREEAKRRRQQETMERLERQRAHAAQYGAPPQVYPGQFQQYPGGGYQQYPGRGFQQQAYGPQYQQPRRGFGGGGMALPLVGGLAGGLLLGDMLGGDGFGGDGGDFGGGDFGGGDFGGGF